jgi:hypothetical protein
MTTLLLLLMMTMMMMTMMISFQIFDFFPMQQHDDYIVKNRW